MRRGDLRGRRAPATEALELFRVDGEEQELIGPLSILGVVAGSRDDHARSRPLYEEMEALARKVGDGYGLAMALNNQAYAAWMTDGTDRAGTLWEESLTALASTEGDLEGAASLLGAAASIRQAGGTVEPAVLVHLEAVTAAAMPGLGDDFAAAFGRGRATAAEVVGEEVARGASGKRPDATLRKMAAPGVTFCDMSPEARGTSPR